MLSLLWAVESLVMGRRLHRVKWYATEPSALSKALSTYTNCDIGGLVQFPENYTYFLAVARGHPLALIACSDAQNSQSAVPTQWVDFFCINDLGMRKLNVNGAIWHEFERTYGYVPFFDVHTVRLVLNLLE